MAFSKLVLFGPKAVGFGIGPVGWGGWLVVLAFAAAIFALRYFPGIGRGPLWAGRTVLLVALVLVAWATYDPRGGGA